MVMTITNDITIRYDTILYYGLCFGYPLDISR